MEHLHRPDLSSTTRQTILCAFSDFLMYTIPLLWQKCKLKVANINQTEKYEDKNLLNKNRHNFSIHTLPTPTFDLLHQFMRCLTWAVCQLSITVTCDFCTSICQQLAMDMIHNKELVQRGNSLHVVKLYQYAASCPGQLTTGRCNEYQQNLGDEEAYYTRQ